MERAQAMSMVHERFARSDPDLPNGFAEHAPMGAEAMLVLGLEPASVAAWADRHDPVTRASNGAFAGRRQVIREELESAEWRQTAQRRMAGLVPDLDAHLFHGLIRTAHAIRSLEHHEDASGRDELATALAAWELWASDRPASCATGAVSGRAAAGIVADAARRGAAAFLARPSIFTLHAVTAPMAFLLLGDLIDDSTAAAGAAAFERTHRQHSAQAPNAGHAKQRPEPHELETLIDQWDAHPAKLVEAALRGHDLTGDDVFVEIVWKVLRP